MQPALQLFYIHNGHCPDQDFEQLKALSPDLPLVGMAPHVASYVSNRLQQQHAQQEQQQGQQHVQQGQQHAQQGQQHARQGQQHAQQEQQQAAGCAVHKTAATAGSSTAEWLLPTWPFEPQRACSQVRRFMGPLVLSCIQMACCAVSTDGLHSYCVCAGLLSMVGCASRSLSCCVLSSLSCVLACLPQAQSAPARLVEVTQQCIQVPDRGLCVEHVQGDSSALKGFSIIGSLDQSLRNYGKMWELIRSYQQREGPDALQHFKLNILGDVMGDFVVPGEAAGACRVLCCAALCCAPHPGNGHSGLSQLRVLGGIMAGRLQQQVAAPLGPGGLIKLSSNAYSTVLQRMRLTVSLPVLWSCCAEDLQHYVELYKTPPDPVFYDIIYHSYGIVPALANPAYYTCKLTSAVITTLMTGTAPLPTAWTSKCMDPAPGQDTRS